MTSTLPTERLCTCTHAAVVHQLNPAKARTWCTHMDGSGQCQCKRFTEEA